MMGRAERRKGPGGLQIALPHEGYLPRREWTRREKTNQWFVSLFREKQSRL
jgi:hypothetical protein